jgi:hypothetical protein
MKKKRQSYMHLYDARKLVLALLRRNADPSDTSYGILPADDVRALRVMLNRTIVRGTCGLCGKTMEN